MDHTFLFLFYHLALDAEACHLGLGIGHDSDYLGERTKDTPLAIIGYLYLACLTWSYGFIGIGGDGTSA